MKTWQSLLFIFVFCALAAPALAALPPLDDAERQDRSSNTFRGKVRAVYSRREVLDDESSNAQLILEIEVTEGEKGEFKTGQFVWVKCWFAERRPDRWVGDGGQRPVPREGDTGLFYVTGSITTGFSLLHPNGWNPD